MAKASKKKNSKKKKSIQITGTPLQKFCLAVQLIVVVGMLVYFVFANIYKIDETVTTTVLVICCFIEILFLNIPNIFSSK